MHELVCAEKKHLSLLIELVSTTGIYKRGIEGNKLGLSFQEFMLRFVLTPSLLMHAYVLIDRSSQDEAVGCLIGGRTTDLDRDSSDWTLHLHDDVYDGIVTPLSALKAPGQFLIHSLAIRDDWQGRGLGRKLLLEAVSIAERAGCDNDLSLVVWANDVRAIALYNSAGFVVTDVARPSLVGFPPLLLMQRNNDYLSFEEIST